MRLYELRMRAFGPFAGEQRIDFDSLSAGGLFLLEGPTGAGKTTVLDAITFALFGPGEGGGNGRLHSNFAAADVVPEVILDFSIRGQRHRVSRSPAYDRPKRHGAGMTRQATQAHLERFEEHEWSSRTSNPREVGEMIAEAIGLTRDQFTQVVLLPQGEFAKFLRANDDERRPLLTRLFGVQLYDRISAELEERGKLASRAIDAARSLVLAAVAATAEAARTDAGIGTELAALTTVERGLRLDEIQRQLAVRVSGDAAAARAAQGGDEAARQVLEATHSHAERLKRFVAACDAQRNHERGRGAHEERAEQLALALKAVPVRPLLESLAVADEAVDQAQARVSAHAEKTPVGSLTRDDERQEQQLSEAASRHAAEIQQWVELELQLPTLESMVASSAAELGRAEAVVGELSDRQRDAPRADAVLEAELARARVEVTGLGAAREQSSATERRLSAARARDLLSPKADAARASRAAAIDAHQLSVDEHQRVQDLRLAGMAAELASGLAEGQACVVCGSADHPSPAQPEPSAVSAAAVTAAAQRRERRQSERDAAEATLRGIETEYATALALAGQAASAELEAQLIALRATVSAGAIAAERVTELSEQLAVRALERGALADELTAARETQAGLAEKRRSQQLRLDDVRAQLESERGDYASVAAHQARLQQAAAQHRAGSIAIAGLLDVVGRQARVQARATAEAVANGFVGLEQARAAVRPASWLAEFTELVANWSSAEQQLQAAVASAEFNVFSQIIGVPEQQRALDAAQVSEAEALANSEAAKKLEAEAAARLVTTENMVANVLRCRSGLNRAEAELTQIAADSEPVLYLSKLTRGMTGQRRVALTTYVLRQWFEQVVQAANIRLSAVSSGRYELVRVDAEASQNVRAGLTLQVLDRHNGEQRSPRSLSGGETFYTSLALALGLADVVKAEAGGVELDTLFIDEGFGTLDPETLEQVMSVIDDLRNGGRVVGIVSHVGDLKERIPEHVEIRRLADGSSTVLC